MKLKLLFICMLCMCLGSLSAQTIRYVKPVATGTGDGSSWANASGNLQLMINNSSSGSQVWAAAGTYRPGSLSSAPTNRNQAFYPKSNVKVYGSFAGTETSVEERNIAANPTILSGDLLGNDVITNTASLIGNSTMNDNAYHVVVASYLDVNTVFDGFTITGGYANGSTTYNSMYQYQGGGMYIADADGVYSNIIIKNCYGSSGGGIYINNYSTYFTRFNGIAITNCVAGSVGTGDGAAIYAWGSGTKSEFYNLLVANCIGESAVTEGWQMYLRNATFYNISAGSSSAYNCVIDGSPYLYNSIIGQHSQGNAVIMDNTMWSYNNSIYGTVKTNSKSWYSTADVTNTGNPGFVDAANGDFRLAAGSNCINTGDDQYLYSYEAQAKNYPQVVTDIAGNTRSQGTVDKGAYEFNQQAIRYVKTVASGTGDGSSWANASSDLQLMINNSGTGDQIWVAKGTYKPNRQINAVAITANHRDNTFLLKSGVKIYGSFNGDETTIQGRQFQTNATILSGDFSGNDPNNTTNAALLNSTLTNENAHHVVVAINLSSTTVFDGFVITGGVANGSGSVSVNVTPTTTQNMVRTNGGGMYVISSSGLFSNIAIKASRASSGGGIYIYSGSSYSVPRFSGLIITGCLAGSGSSSGSAIYCQGSGSNQETKAEFFNMLVTNCAGDNTIYVTAQYTQLYISNATFYGLFTTYEDALYAAVIVTNSAGYVTLANSIIGQHAYGFAFNIGASSFVTTKSYNNSVYKGKRGDGTLVVLNDTANTGNPGFVNAAGGDFSLSSGSSAINNGNDSYLVTTAGTAYGYPAIVTDIAGNTRSRNTLDQGAYESNYDPNTIRYVKTVASGTGDGSSWANASSDLQLMLNNSHSGNQVWVAKGTYKPNRQPNSAAITANHRDNTFFLKSGVKVYGSFAGNESSIEGRQFETNATILSGDFSGNDPNNNNPVQLLNETLTSDNAYHVVMGLKISKTTVLDGFVITGGAATGDSYYAVAGSIDGMWRGYGGGLMLESSSGQFNNVAIRNSIAGLGGGMHIKNTVDFVPRFTGLVITGCITGSTGGGFGSAFSYFGTSGTSTRAEFFNMLVTNCVGQSAIRVATGSSLVYMDNATFYGIYSNVTSTTSAVIETVSGGAFGLYNSIIGQHAQANPISIASGTVGTGLYNSIFGTVKSSGTWTTNNSTTNTGNPGFVNVAEGDFSLTISSPVRGLGNTQYLTTTSGTNNGYTAISTDIIGKPRLNQGLLDLGAYQYHPPCTIPEAPTAGQQVFCSSATVADLTAEGTDLKWYADSTGGTALPAATVLSTGTYYVSQSNGLCESARTAVSVVMGTTPDAPVASQQTFCGDVTIAMLAATGENLKWYTEAAGGTAIEASTALSTGTYYVSQSNTNCESTRTAVQITVTDLPAAPLAAALQTFCGTATVADLSSDTPETNWYTTASGGISLPYNTALTTGTYYGSQMNVSCESERTAVEVVVNPIPQAPVVPSMIFCNAASVAEIIATGDSLKVYATATSDVALEANELLVTGTYYLSKKINNCESERTTVAITVGSVPEAPVASAQTLCGAATIADLMATGDNLKWFTSEDAGAELAYNTVLTTGIYYVSQNNGICDSARTAVTVTIGAIPSAPVASAQTFCGVATVANLVATGDNLKWFTSENGGDELTSATSLVTGIYYVSQNNGVCESALTAVDVTVGIVPEAPEASAQTFCGVATVGNLTATGINLKWYATETGGDELASATSLVTGTYYVSQNNTICESTRTAVAVTIGAIPSAPVASAQSFCGVAMVANLTATGNNLKWYTSENGGDALASATSLVTGIYYVSQSNTICESTRTAVEVIVNVVPDAPLASAQNFCGAATVGNLSATGNNLKWYTTEIGGDALASGTSLATGTYYVSQNNTICESSRTAVAVTVSAVPQAPQANKQVFCGEHTVASLTAIGTNLKWYAAETGGNALASGTVLTTGVYYVSQTVNGCESVRTAVSVIIDVIPVQPVAFAQTFCEGATVSSLVATGTHIKWYTSNTGDAALASNTVLATGIYYVSDNNAYCESPRAEVQVIVNTLPEAPVAKAQIFCGATTLASLEATGVNLKWYAVATGGEVLASSATISTGTYYVSQMLYECEGPRTAVQVVVAEILSAPVAQAAQVHCTTATVADLTATGTNLKWYSQAEGGSAIVSTELLTAGTYYVSQTGGICESPRTAVTVTLFAGCTGLESNYCNITVPRFGTALYATIVPGATNYRFRAVRGTSVQVVETAVRYFAIANLPEYNYDATYSVSVSVFKDGEWSPYGPACNVSTMPVPSTSQLRTEFCGQILQSLTTAVYAESLPLATAYRFRINNNGSVQVIEKNTVYFMVNEIAGYTYDKTYSIDVSVRINGQWSEYGSPCAITTPPATTQLAAGYCGTTVAAFTTNVYAANAAMATGYRFRINDNNAIQVIEKLSGYFTVNEIAGHTYNKTYSIDVSVRVNGQWGNYGDACTLSTPVAVTQLAPGYCGATMPLIKSVVYANNVPLATAYRFRIVSGNSTYYLTNTARYFVLSNVPGNAYGKTYTVDVAVQTGNNWGPYGNTCTVSTPNAPVNRQSNVTTDETVSQVPQAVTLTSYPNPYTDVYTIDMNTHSPERVTVRTFDMNGRLVEDITVSPEELSSHKMGGRYAQGVYNVIVSQGDYIKSFKIVKK